MMEVKPIDLLGEWNPQLLRELKGRLKPRNLLIATAISIVGQILIYFEYKSRLPLKEGVSHRYCTGSPPPQQQEYYYGINNYCTQDFQGHLMILDNLWWLDIFTCISLVGIFAFLVIGTYLLIADLSNEENRGTLNFIRLSPQSAKAIFLGKILGVPLLLYFVGALAIPFHLIAGLSAGISLELILVFYGVLIASCAFFYSAALLFALVGHKLGGLQGFLTSGTILGFLLIATGWLSHRYSFVPNVDESNPATPFNFFLPFNPATSLPYLVQSTFIAPETIGYFSFSHASELGWYGQAIWSYAASGISFILINFALWTYWIYQGLKRYFHSPTATLLGKSQSYGVTVSFITIALGFVLQTTNAEALFDNYTIAFGFLMAFFIVMMLAINPHRLAMQDWMRYRHLEKPKHLIYDLLFGEKSPATLAIAINLGIVITFLVPAIALSPLEQYKSVTVFRLLSTASTILIYAAIAQWILLQKSQKRTIWVGGTLFTLISLPKLCLAVLEINSYHNAGLWFFSIFSTIAIQPGTSMFSFLMTILGQCTILALVNLQMTRQLRKLGESSTKALLY